MSKREALRRLREETPRRVKPWWCDCDSGEGYDGEHELSCYGNSIAFPRLTAALAAASGRSGEGGCMRGEA